MEINKQFWEQVLKEYEGSGKTYICQASVVFAKVWEDEKSEIRDLAIKFLKENPIKDTEILSDSHALFDVSNYYDRNEEIIKFKTEFIKWCIQQ